MDRLTVGGIRLYGIHGVLETEKVAPQEFEVTVNVFGYFPRSKDDISNAIDYRRIVEVVRYEIEKTSRDLIETITTSISQKLVEDFISKELGIHKVCVEVTKLNPPLPGKPIAQFSREAYLANRCYLALGSNLGDRVNNLMNALSLLPNPVRTSPIFEAKSVGAKTLSPNYLNMVVELLIDLDPFELLKIINEIEKQLGRKRNIFDKNFSRIIDIDIIYYGGFSVSSTSLTIPHPRYKQRGFVLAPLMELRPDLVGHEFSIAMRKMVNLFANIEL